MGQYRAPRTIEELAGLLSRADSSTFFVAGGTDLTIKLREQKIFDFNLIDLSRVESLSDIDKDEGSLRIGAAVTMTDLARNPLVVQSLNAMTTAASRMGSTQIRNRATIGGNVANASQCADLLTVLMACGSLCEILSGSNGLRKDRIENVVIGLGKTTLARDEVITRFIVPIPAGLSGFSKIGSRKAVAISKLNCCLIAEREGKNIKSPVIYLGAVGPKPVRASLLEAALEGRPFRGEVVHGLQDAIRRQIETLIPTRASRHYKKEAAIGLLEDTIDDCLALEGGMGRE